MVKSRNHSRLFLLLGIFLIFCFASVSAQDGNSETHAEEKAWRIIWAKDPEVEDFLQKNWAKITFKQNLVSVSGICNGCGAELHTEEQGFICTMMWCGDQAGKTEQYVLDVLTKNGMSFVERDIDYEYIVVEGAGGKSIKLKVQTGPDGHPGKRRGGKSAGFVNQVPKMLIFGISFLVLWVL